MLSGIKDLKNSKITAMSISGGVVFGLGMIGLYYTEIAAMAAADKMVELHELHHANDLNVVDSNGVTSNYHHDIHHRHGTTPEQTTTCFANRQVLRGRASPGLFKLSNPNTGTQEIVIDANPLAASLQCFRTTLARDAVFLKEKQQDYLSSQLLDVVNNQTKTLTAEGKLKLAKMINDAHVYTSHGKFRSYGSSKLGSGNVTINRPSMFGSASIVFYSEQNYTERQLQQTANNFINTLIGQLPPSMRLNNPKPTATAPGLVRR